MRTLVIGDIHGRYEALLEVLKKSKFDKEKDRLICLGDIVDGGYDTFKVVEELLTINNFTLVLGNHDHWFMEHISWGFCSELWIQQGGKNTVESYGGKVIGYNGIMDDANLDTSDLNIPVTHQDLFNKGKYFHKETINGKKMLFVHGGFNIEKPIEKQTAQYVMWDRDLFKVHALKGNIDGYDDIFVGHTATDTVIEGTMTPLTRNNVTLLDTGAGWIGKLTIMDVETREYWQSSIQVPAR